MSQEETGDCNNNGNNNDNQEQLSLNMDFTDEDELLYKSINQSEQTNDNSSLDSIDNMNKMRYHQSERQTSIEKIVNDVLIPPLSESSLDFIHYLLIIHFIFQFVRFFKHIIDLNFVIYVFIEN